MENKDTQAPEQDIAAVVEGTPELKTLKPQQKEAVIKMARGVSFSSSYQGPIPSPDMLKAYIDINPELGNRIFALTEKQLEHRISKENKLVSLSGRGQLLAFFVAVLVIGAGCYALYLGNTACAIAIFTTTIISLVATFLVSVGSAQGQSK